MLKSGKVIAEDGSSPRARGTHDQRRSVIHHWRFIPAGAGNTRRPRRQNQAGSVHPRGRGEHLPLMWAGWPDPGSSPRARGTLQWSEEEAQVLRFIPAGAGNTLKAPALTGMVAVHPRGRGEHGRAEQDCHLRNGSSPRARGTHGYRLAHQFDQRFIPAGAGNTLSLVAASKQAPVHPRGRGEHDEGRRGVRGGVGSSPRARGTHQNLTRRRFNDRFIPAGAGNTFMPGNWMPCGTVHPRGRGEHYMKEAKDQGLSGSSPRARGTRIHGTDTRPPARFIPAGAGNTPPPDRAPTRPTVHPRGRGEHEYFGAQHPANYGSSPRARGTPDPGR